MRLEVAYNQLMRTLDFIWIQEQVNLNATMYDSIFMETHHSSKTGNHHPSTVPGFIETVDSANHLNSILVRKLYKDFKSSLQNGRQRNQNPIKRIPENLIQEFLELEEEPQDDEEEERQRSVQVYISPFI